MSQGTPAHSNVYVRGLPLECNEATLLSLFQTHGAISSLRLFQQPNKPSFAFVKFSDVQEAQRAISALNGAAFGGCIMEVRFADCDVGAHPDRTPPPSDNIFCRGFAPGCSEEDIQSLLGSYGLVKSVKILHHGDQSGQGAAALVRMGSVDEATRAVLALHGQQIMGSASPLVVRFADSMEIKVRKQAKQHGGLHSPFNLPATIAGQQALVSTASAPAFFSSVDPTLASSMLPSGGIINQGPALSMPSMPSMPLSMSGLLPAGLSEQASMYMAAGPSSGGSGTIPLDALTSATGASLPGNRLGSPMLSQGQQQQLMMAAHAQAPQLAAIHGLTIPSAAALMSVAYGTTGSTSLYIKNLPETADRLFLYEKFSPFGAIHSVKILQDDSGKSRCCGFVNFEDPMSAAKAVSALHNMPIGDRVLHVAFQLVRK